MKYIDLSVSINKQTPIFPGDPAIKITPAGILEKNGYQDHQISLATHVGTHIDAPAHMLAGGKTLDQFPVDKFLGNGICIKVMGEFELETIKNVEIEEGNIVLFHTGLSDIYNQPEYFENYPDISEEIATYLVERKVKMVGLDMFSPDHQPFPIHKILLSSNILIIENLTNLDQLTGKKFKIYAFPIKLQVDGAPARVVAEVV